MWPGALTAAMDLFDCMEEYYCLKGIHFEISRSIIHQSLREKFAFQCSSSLGKTLK